MYKDKLNDIMYDVNKKAISSKILQYMDRIRNNSDEGQARRFVWELIQNAKDVARQDIPLRIRITMDSEKLVFAHNGKNFKLKNLMSLINQVSGKSGNAEEVTTGKFGTGFITTHLLSERVNVRGILEDFGFEPKPFEIVLDRSGRNDKEITEAVDRSIDVICHVDDNADSKYDPEELNTEFEYHLETDYSRSIAQIGMNDAYCNIFYCMAFVPRLYEITLDDRTSDKITVYRKTEEKDVDDSITEFYISENDKKHKVTVVSDGEVQIAAETDEDNNVVSMSEKSSKLFCGFPLIDNVMFPFPTAVNSDLFKVNEPRSCITLTDNPNSTDSEINKKLMSQAVILYGKLLDHAEENNVGKLFRMINTPPVFQRSDISDTWINENIISGISRLTASHRILPGKNGKFAAAEKKTAVPTLDYPELVGEMNDLVSAAGYEIIAEDSEEWCSALRSIGGEHFQFFTIKSLLSFAHNSKTVDTLAKTLSEDVYVWLRKLYLCAAKVESFKNEILVGTYSIIPAQSGKLREFTNVYAETEKIDEYFKNICDIIDGYLPASSSLNIRDQLIASELDTDGYENIRDFKIDYLINHLYTGMDKQYQVHSQKMKLLMGACCPNERGYSVYKTLIKEFPDRYEPELKLPPEIWNDIYRSLQNYLNDAFARIGSTEELFEVFGGEEKAIDAINYFYEVDERYYNKLRYYKYSLPLLVSAGGEAQLNLFTSLLNISSFVINDGVDEMMMLIYEKINSDGAKLIDKRIKVSKNLGFQTMNKLSAASVIGNKITAALTKGALYNQSKEFQQGCSLLMRWINNNEEEAKELFPAYASKENRMKLLTAEQAADMSSRLDSFNKLLTNYKINSIEEFEENLAKMSTMLNDRPEDDLEAITPENEITEEFYSFGYSKEKNNFDEIIRLIGEAGESLAVDVLKEKFGEEADVLLCNDTSHKQQGYDIIVTKSDGTKLFYEVKTRTKTSIFKKTLMFSQSQARRLSDRNFRVLLIIIDKKCALVSSSEFENILDDFSRGRFVRSDGFVIETK